MVRLMVGRSIERVALPPLEEDAPEILRVGGLAVEDPDRPDGRRLSNVSLTPRRGEILGLAGLQGSGRSAVVRALFGSPPAATGEIRIDGRPTPIRRPADAMAAGIGFVPEDRKVLGIFHEADVKVNVCMAGLDRFSRHGFTDPGRFREVARRVGDDLSIKMRSVDAPIRSLSGGNQQKVLISRWLALKPSLLLMSEPTRGVDVGAKHEICEIINEMARNGASVLFVSAEMEELMGVCDRIMVMRGGKIVGDLSRGEYHQERIMNFALGGRGS